MTAPMEEAPAVRGRGRFLRRLLRFWVMRHRHFATGGGRGAEPGRGEARKSGSPGVSGMA